MSEAAEIPSPARPSAPFSPSVKLAVIVAALGYLVDIYDLILFGVVRRDSLLSIGVAEADVLVVGVRLLNYQMTGMLVGGVLWGILGDKRGRLSVLFGSILMYSLANIANGFVTDVETYAWLRLIAGIGLAGELGAGITLVSEMMPADKRGIGTTIIAGVGICGALLAAGVATVVQWNYAYWLGGIMGLLLLALRVGVLESGIFQKTKESGVTRGNFFALFTNRRRALRYVCVILCGMPVWFAIGLLASLAEEIAGPTGLGLSPAPTARIALLFAYLGLAIGDFGSGWISQVLKSRKRVLFAFVGFNAVAIAAYATLGASSIHAFYACVLVLGITNGYWAVFVTVAAEQFGTNLRATATTTAPNFVRGSVVPMNLAFLALKPSLGVLGAALAVGAVVVVVAFVAIFGIEETFGKPMDFVEDEGRA
ncbi:MAG: MFS transporter [Deltaproteobacteria bacterium]|nr:MFS transporter [Deltaproteobacteria bacterium]